MALTRSFPTQHPSGLPLVDHRRLMAGRLARNSDGTPRTGVLPAHANALVTGRASMAYDVGAFNAITARTAGGAEEIANDATTIVATTAAPGANSRIDVIWVRAQFQVLGDASNDVVFGVTQGAAAVSPTKPAVPAGALELATATIPSTATTTQSSGVVITQTFPYTAMAGGAVWFRNGTDLAAWTPADGALAYRIDTAEVYQRRAGAWKYASGDTGWVQIPLSNNWTNFAGTSYQGAEACKINGVVEVAGLVSNSSAANANPGVLIGTLPVGMRPKAYLMFTVWANGGARPVEVAPDGRIVVGDTAISAIRTSLAFSFRADN